MSDSIMGCGTESNFPPGLHSRIMKKFFFLRNKCHFVITELILILGGVFSGWHLWNDLNNLNTISVMKALLDGFSLNSDFFRSFTETVEDSFPWVAVLLFLVNVAAVIYLGYIFFQFNNLKSLGRD